MAPVKTNTNTRKRPFSNALEGHELERPNMRRKIPADRPRGPDGKFLPIKNLQNQSVEINKIEPVGQLVDGFQKVAMDGFPEEAVEAIGSYSRLVEELGFEFFKFDPSVLGSEYLIEPDVLLRKYLPETMDYAENQNQKEEKLFAIDNGIREIEDASLISHESRRNPDDLKFDDEVERKNISHEGVQVDLVFVSNSRTSSDSDSSTSSDSHSSSASDSDSSSSSHSDSSITSSDSDSSNAAWESISESD